MFGQGAKSLQGEFFAIVSPQIGAVTPWTGTGTAREVDGECNLVGKFLKHDVVIDVFEHRGRPK